MSIARWGQAFSLSYDLAPCPPPTPIFLQYKLDRRHKGRLRKRDNLLPGEVGKGGGRGAESYDSKKAWSSINRQILSGWSAQDIPPYQPSLLPPIISQLVKASIYWGGGGAVPTLDRVEHWTSSVGRHRGLGRPPAPNESLWHLAGFAYAPDQVYWIGAPPSDARSAHTYRTPPLRSAKARSSWKSGVASLNQINRDGMVRSGAK